jgi:hypothetical protein
LLQNRPKCHLSQGKELITVGTLCRISEEQKKAKKRRFGKFTIYKNKDWIYAFSDSIQIVHEKKYQPKDIMVMSDIDLNRK